MGYYRAGFDVVGVDIKPQPHYPFEFIQADAMEFPLGGFDAVHASPPCQGYSIMATNLPWHRGREYPFLLLPTRVRLRDSAKPYVIENVAGARHGAPGLASRGLENHGMQAGFLCGLMFEIPMYRHRYFETDWDWLAPGHPKHRLNAHPRSERYVYGGSVKGLPGGAAGLDTRGNGAQKNGCGVGHAAGWRQAAEMMGIDWMKRDELTQAIPPAYTEYIGRELMRVLL